MKSSYTELIRALRYELYASPPAHAYFLTPHNKMTDHTHLSEGYVINEWSPTVCNERDSLSPISNGGSNITLSATVD